MPTPKVAEPYFIGGTTDSGTLLIFGIAQTVKTAISKRKRLSGPYGPATRLRILRQIDGEYVDVTDQLMKEQEP